MKMVFRIISIRAMISITMVFQTVKNVPITYHQAARTAMVTANRIMPTPIQMVTLYSMWMKSVSILLIR